ncbi:hypothetical protein B0H14DRAFT_2373590, partial [Mycena olivaceomarginata]
LASSLAGITKPDIMCLLHHGGVKRTSELMYQETRGALKIFLLQVIRDAAAYTDHGPSTRGLKSGSQGHLVCKVCRLRIAPLWKDSVWI